MKFQKYINLALEAGAKRAVEFDISDIAFDPRVALKCLFGCEAFGKGHTCPFQRSPLGMNEYKVLFSHYSGGIVIGCGDRKQGQDISFDIEEAAFFDGYYFAFSLSDCSICNSCTRTSGGDCRMPKKARPSFHGVGIDVFKTVRKLGLPLEVAKTYDDEINWYSAVFIE